LVTPGTIGFLATLAVVVVVIFLIRDALRRVRRVRARSGETDAYPIPLRRHVVPNQSKLSDRRGRRTAPPPRLLRPGPTAVRPTPVHPLPTTAPPIVIPRPPARRPRLPTSETEARAPSERQAPFRRRARSPDADRALGRRGPGGSVRGDGRDDQ